MGDDAYIRALPPATRAAFEVGSLGRLARRLAAAGDPGAAEAEAAYIKARRAGEEAGLIMRRIELADLRDRHSAILPPDATVTVGVGWRALVDDALDRLGGMHVIVTLIREKLGGLDVSVWPRERWRPEDFGAVTPAMSPAKEAALRTCEACGAAGTMRRDGRWRTRCDAHADVE